VLIFDNHMFIICSSLSTREPLHAVPAADPINPHAASMFVTLLLNPLRIGSQPRAGVSDIQGRRAGAMNDGAPPGVTENG
jgi:hypothetical protein